MKNWGFVFLGGSLLVGAGLGASACGDDTSSGGGGATASSGTPTTNGSPSATGSTHAATGSSSTAVGSGSATGASTSTGSSTSSGNPGTLDCDPSDASAFTLMRTTVADGLERPVLVKSAPDDAERLYVVEQTGKVRIVEGGVVLATPFIDVSDLIDFDGQEQGLLGLAFHPDYATNGRFYLHYSNGDGTDDSTVQEFHRSTGDIHVADHDPVQLVMRTTTAQTNHNGGSTEFGNDGFLYISLGDGGNQGDPECDAQKTTNGDLLGKIMRLDVDGTPDANGYPAAAGNPDGGRVYHKGFRNPWRTSFDGCTGDLYIGDVGQNTYEEVDRITAADGPRNFGWPYREGAHNYSTPGTCPANPGNLYEPFYDYTHGGGRCAVSGGYVFRSTAIPGLRGTYFFADECAGTVWSATPDGSGGFTVAAQNAISGGSISGFGIDGNGNVYIVDLSGTVDRIDPM